jgi:hypothetical protein
MRSEIIDPTGTAIWLLVSESGPKNGY